MPATWIRRPWGWARKGAAALAGFLGYGSGGYGQMPYGE